MKGLMLFVFLALWSSCNTIPVPKGESCVILENDCFCKNTIDDSEYFKDCASYIAVSPERYNQLQNHYDSVAKRLLICKQNPKKCR